MLFFIFGRCPKNCSMARKKLFCPTLWVCSPPSPPNSYAYAIGVIKDDDLFIYSFTCRVIAAFAFCLEIVSACSSRQPFRQCTTDTTVISMIEPT